MAVIVVDLEETQSESDERVIQVQELSEEYIRRMENIEKDVKHVIEKVLAWEEMDIATRPNFWDNFFD